MQKGEAVTVAPYEVPRGAIVIGGKAWPCAAPVTLWRDSGLEFKPGRGARRRKSAIDLVVWHYTAGEGSAERVYRNLLNHKTKSGVSQPLGIEFIIDTAGMIWQCCDPAEVDTFDVGAVNARSVGVEIVSRGTAPILPGYPRAPYHARVNGEKVTFLRYHHPQLQAACALAEALSRALDIPRAVPASLDVMGPALASFKGHIGHSNVVATKLDPGPDLIAAFIDKGFANVG